MKKLILLLTIFFSLNAYSQVEDLYIDAKMIAPNVIELNNLKNCEIRAQFKTDSAVVMNPDLRNELGELVLPPGKTAITLHGTLTKFEVKALTMCYWSGDMPKWFVMPVEEFQPLVQFKSMEVKKLGADSATITFETVGKLKVKQHNVQFSLDGKTWTTKTIIIPPKASANGTYSVNVKL